MAHTVLVTGATGMIGQALVPLLARRNDVRAIFALTHERVYGLVLQGNAGAKRSHSRS